MSSGLGIRYKKAIDFTWLWHKDQVRKDGSPYVGHLLRVSGHVMELMGAHGEPLEDAAIVALLHDSVEDAGVDLRGDQWVDIWGSEVIHYVYRLSEDKTEERPIRKAKYVNTMRTVELVPLVVSIADKWDNLKGFELLEWDEERESQRQTFYEGLVAAYQDNLKGRRSLMDGPIGELLLELTDRCRARWRGFTHERQIL